MKTIYGKYELASYGISKGEKRILLSLFNMVNDQGFANWIDRGATWNWTFQKDPITEGYLFHFKGGPFKILVQNNGKDGEEKWEFYLVKDSHGIRKAADLFSIDSWEKIDKWLKQDL
jgi:hypothetical protein